MNSWKTVLAVEALNRSSTVADIFDDVADRGLCDGVFQGLFFDLLDRIDDGGVVAATELLADLDHRHLRDFTDDVHGDLPGEGDICVALGGFDIFGRYAVGAADLLNDFFDRYGRRLVVVDDIADGALRGIDRRGCALDKVDGLELL